MRRLLLLSLLFLSTVAFAVDSVKVLPLEGFMGTAKIEPPNGSAVAYLMNFPGQAAISFKNNADTEVFIGTYSAITHANGYGLLTKGESISLDIKGGTTLYFYGNGASADIRAFIAR